MTANLRRILCVLLVAIMMLTSCQKADDPKSNTTDNIAKSSDLIGSTIEADGSVVPASDINEGTYELTAESSSSMFVIDSCSVTVEKGQIKAEIAVEGTSYSYICIGTPEEAVASDGSDYVKVSERDGNSTFDITVDSINEVFDIATYSVKKEMWYGRQIVIKSDNLPIEAYKNIPFDTVSSLGIEDGKYLIDVVLEGGSGRASIETPTKLTVKDGTATAEIVWSSKFYDYMIVKGQKYLPVNEAGNSTFEIPVDAFNCGLTVIGDTTAMSKPHEITYKLSFDSSSIKEL